MKYTLISLCISVFACLGSPAALSQNEGRWYTVEVLMFKRLDNTYLSSEYWRSDEELRYPKRLRSLKPNTGEANKSDLSLRPQTEHRLGNYAYALRKSENYRVLFHKAWQQQMQGKSNSPAIAISSGESLGDYRELEGSIKFHIARYLHISTDLWLSNNAIPNDSGTSWPHVPSKSEQNNSNTPVAFEMTPSTPVVAVRQQRRMRSNELHYIDHPLMGILVSITPIK